jgi:two-component system chemotaxis response regulator CheY
MRLVLSRLLIMRGFEVAVANDIEEASAMVSKGNEPVNLVMVEWKFPETDNLAMIASAQTALHGSTIIMLTSVEPSMRDIQKALIAGANDYLMKPFTGQQMDEKLANAGLTMRRNQSVMAGVVEGPMTPDGWVNGDMSNAAIGSKLH